MNLVQGSPLIDAGVDLGFPYKGNAPDLGAFESDYTTSVIDNVNLPIGYALYQNYPNPFNPETVIGYYIPYISKSENNSFQQVLLKVYDIMGKEIATLVNEARLPGKHEVKFNGSNMASGIYFYRLLVYVQGTGEMFSQTKKLLLIK